MWGQLRRVGELASFRADAALVGLSMGAAVVTMQVAAQWLVPVGPTGDLGAADRRGDAVSIEDGTELFSGPAAGLALHVQGEVDGLSPGVVRPLPVLVDNGSISQIVIVRVDVEVGAPSIGACPAAALTVGPEATAGGGSLDTEVLVEPAQVAVIEVPVLMAHDAPASCQGAIFPLTLRATGVLP